MHTIKCKNCQKVKEVKSPKTKFCSVKCANVYNAKNGKVGGDRASLKALIDCYGEVKGKAIYEERCKKRSLLMKGCEPPFKGKKHTDKSKQKCSDSVKQSDYHQNIRGKRFDEIRGEGASQRLSNKMKGTFSLSWFIERYGDKEGNEKYIERAKLISKTSLLRKPISNENNYSNISQELFWAIFKRLKLKKEDVYFAELNHEFGCHTNKNFDFVLEANKKIIEFNGNIWHANPLLFNENDCPNPFKKELTSKEIWKSDEDKNNKAILNGYEILIVWEDEYKNFSEETINKCINFLRD